MLLLYTNTGLTPGLRRGSPYAGHVVLGGACLVTFADDKGNALGATVMASDENFESARLQSIAPLRTDNILVKLGSRGVELIYEGRQVSVTCS